MLVGGGAGGGYDTYARVFARHLSRHIPGNPNIIAKNMPAAGPPFAAPPGVPADRLTALRRAFDATLADGEFRADADKAQLEIEPLTAAEIETLLAKAYSAPRAIVQKAAALIESPGRAP